MYKRIIMISGSRIHMLEPSSTTAISKYFKTAAIVFQICTQHSQHLSVIMYGM